MTHLFRPVPVASARSVAKEEEDDNDWGLDTSEEAVSNRKKTFAQK